MAQFETTLIPTQTTAFQPFATGITQPTVSAATNILDEFPGGLIDGEAARPRTSVGNEQKKCLSGVGIGAGQVFGVGDDYFEDIYVLPITVNAGTILSQISLDVTVHSSYRSGTVQWTGYDDSAAGAGVELTDPSPPPPTINLRPLSSSEHQLVISAEGAATISAEIDFDFTDPASASVSRSITLVGRRSVVFAFEPEVPFVEVMEWVTSVRQKANGEEQRASLREVPRSTYRMRFLVEGDERRRLEGLVYDSQDRPYGLPVWFEATDLEEAIEVDDTTITVTTTDYARFAEDGLAIVWEDSATFEVLQISSITSTTITFNSPFATAFAEGCIVMPVVTGVLVNAPSGARWPINLEEFEGDFIVTDNGESIADTSAFNSFTRDGVARVLWDDPNLMEGDRVSEEWRKLISVIDNGLAAPKVDTSQSVSRRQSQKGALTKTRQQLWELRQLLHALAGRRRAFYLPTFYPDLEVLDNIDSADQSITVKDIDYVGLVQQRPPRDVIRIVASDGTTSDPKVVTGSSKPTPGEESISIAPDNVGVTVTVANIDRVEYVEKARLDEDRIELTHLNSRGFARTVFPVVTVLDGDLT